MTPLVAGASAWVVARRAKNDSYRRSQLRHRHVRRSTIGRRRTRDRRLPQDLATVLHLAAASASFEIVSLDVSAGRTWPSRTLPRCGTPGELERDPGNRLRLTVGLQRDGDRWVVTDEHHSFPRQDLTEGADRAANPQLSPHEPRRTDRTIERGTSTHRRRAADVVGDIGGETATSVCDCAIRDVVRSVDG